MAGCPWGLGHPAGVLAIMPFAVSFSILNNRKSAGHRLVDPCLSRRVSQRHPAGVPGIFLVYVPFSFLKIPERFRKDPGNALRAFPGIPLESMARNPPKPIIQGIRGFQSISRILSPQYGWGSLFFSEVVLERASQSWSWNSQQYWGHFWSLPRGSAGLHCYFSDKTKKCKCKCNHVNYHRGRKHYLMKSQQI